MEAVLVVGPESSGTRMMTEVFVKSGYFGDYTHEQRLDHQHFLKASLWGQDATKIVYRQSYPHGLKDAKIWPHIGLIKHKLINSQYHDIKLVVTLRDKDYMVLSQVNSFHQDTFDAAKLSIETAIDLIFSQAAEAELVPTVVMYEPFVKHESVRNMFYKQFGISPKSIEFKNGNDKYDKIRRLK